MNKQEAIEKLQSEAVNHYSETSGWFKKIKLDIVTDIVNQIYEPKKPVVPQFVADWYENNKDDFEYNLALLIKDYFKGEIEDNNLLFWFGYDLNKNQPIQTLIDMHRFGYEVEKEKLYKARHKLTGEYLSQNYNKTGYYHDLDHFHILKFTEEEWRDLGVWDDSTYEIEEVEE